MYEENAKHIDMKMNTMLPTACALLSNQSLFVATKKHYGLLLDKTRNVAEI